MRNKDEDSPPPVFGLSSAGFLGFLSEGEKYFSKNT